jgi:hypothetical protein
MRYPWITLIGTLVMSMVLGWQVSVASDCKSATARETSLLDRLTATDRRLQEAIAAKNKADADSLEDSFAALRAETVNAVLRDENARLRGELRRAQQALAITPPAKAQASVVPLMSIGKPLKPITPVIINKVKTVPVVRPRKAGQRPAAQKRVIKAQAVPQLFPSQQHALGRPY